MRNYVIINGVNSLTIKGLAINELPPIVKAPMRVLQEEIDGRDGDIITDLGYGAYDKIMTIGLYDGYDINEIIAFFNEEGTIVFSDEADKYYNFKIIEQIDYERLIKFRTASITFHVQPFKYPLTETPVEITNEYVEAEGTNLTLTPTAEAPISIDLKGNTQQVTNLFDGNTTQGYLDYDGTITSSTGWLSSNDYIEIEPSTAYIVNGTNMGARLLYCLYNTNKALIGNRNETTPNTIFTSVSNAKYIKFSTNSSNATNISLTKPITPDYPQPIHNVSGDNTIEICGKNRFNPTYAVQTQVNNQEEVQTTNLYTLNQDGSISCSRYSFAQGRIYFTGLKLKAGTYYVKAHVKITNSTYNDISWSARNLHARTDIKPLTTTTLSTGEGDLAFNFTLSEEVESVGISMQCNRQGTITLTNIMLCDEDIPYEAYTGQSQLISLGDIELCKIGNYQDYFYKTDKWYLHKEIGKYTFTGTEGWFRTNRSDGTTHFYQTTLSSINLGNTTLANELSNNFKLANPYTDNGNSFWLYKSGANEIARIGFSDETIDTADKLKTWLTNNQTITYYILATPTNTEITDTTLLGQLEAIKNKTSYNGTTNINQENNDEPFIIKAKAMKQGSGTATITNSGNIYSKPTIDIEGTGIVDVYIGANQIFSVNVDEEVIIDSTNLEAYKPDGTLANRNVTGNIANLKLPTGNSTIKVDGDIDKATITNYTRYL